ncbi:N-acetylneuraminate synthase [Chloroflexota bacterium]
MEQNLRVKNVTIGNRSVGENEPCFIIAEAGVNHNGDISFARQLIDLASEAGASAVKFQTFRAEEVVTETAEKAEYQKETTGPQHSQYELIKSLELGPDDFRELSAYATCKNIVFLSSPFDFGSVDLLDDLGVPAFKIPSGEITNFPLLKYIADKKKPVILSTGMSFLDEVKEALEVIQKSGLRDIILLHCVTSYPTRVRDVNLKAMETLSQTFGLPVGFSDHTVGINIPIAAVAKGACVIEKHFTLNKSLLGPDHRASLEPVELKAMVSAIREIELGMGDGTKCPTAEEKGNIKATRRSLVARTDIPKGTIITRDQLDIKRPGTGMEPKQINLVIGRKAKQDIASGEVISSDKLV